MQHQIRFAEKFPARVFVFSLSAPAAGCEPAAKKYFANNPEATASSGVANVTFAIQLCLADSAQPTNNSLQLLLLGFPGDVAAMLLLSRSQSRRQDVRRDPLIIDLGLTSAAADSSDSNCRTCSHGDSTEATRGRGPPNQSPHVYITASVHAAE